MTHVKICGLTNLDDARVAIEAGADLLGFNFYPPSPRYVEPTQAAYIIATLHEQFPTQPFHCIGVFVNAPPVEMCAIQRRCGLDGLQLHGDETAADCHAAGPSAFKALRPRTSAEANHWIAEFTGEKKAFASPTLHTPMFLVDAAHAKLYGGTGQTGNWEVARDIATRFPILLAGGLTTENVAHAIVAVRPWGVDAASGVERAPGLKDATKLRQFVTRAKHTL